MQRILENKLGTNEFRVYVMRVENARASTVYRGKEALFYFSCDHARRLRRVPTLQYLETAKQTTSVMNGQTSQVTH